MMFRTTFLTLPREIRDQVYTELVQSLDIDGYSFLDDPMEFLFEQQNKPLDAVAQTLMSTASVGQQIAAEYLRTFIGSIHLVSDWSLVEGIITGMHRSPPFSFKKDLLTMLDPRTLIDFVQNLEILLTFEGLNNEALDDLSSTILRASGLKICKVSFHKPIAKIFDRNNLIQMFGFNEDDPLYLDEDQIDRLDNAKVTLQMISWSHTNETLDLSLYIVIICQWNKHRCYVNVDHILGFWDYGKEIPLHFVREAGSSFHRRTGRQSDVVAPHVDYHICNAIGDPRRLRLNTVEYENRMLDAPIRFQPPYEYKII